MLRTFLRRVAETGGEDTLIFERIAAGWPMQKIAESLGCCRGMLYSFFKTSKTRQDKFAIGRKISADSHAEAGLQILDDVAKLEDVTNAQVKVANSRARYRRWLATIADRERYGQSEKPTVEVSICELHLDALRRSGHMPVPEERPEAEVVEEGPKAIPLPHLTTN